MIIKNINIFTEDKTFLPGTIEVKDGKIAGLIFDDTEAIKTSVGILEEAPANSSEETIIDGEGAYCFPGMIDMHFHGCMGDDFCDGTIKAIETLASYEASIGVTSISPATMTLSAEELKSILATGAAFKEKQENGEYPGYAHLVGVNMEGPFISPAKKGAQAATFILPADAELYHEFQESAKGLVKVIGLAPEESAKGAEGLEKGSDEERALVANYIQEVSKDTSVSLAHTNAPYVDAKMAFENGATHIVHTWNAMSGFSHRSPGVIGAALEQPKVTAELICDGVHVHPAAILGTFRMFGPDRMIFISDSMRAAGMPDGRYTLGGQNVDVRGNLATLVVDGAIAGSVTPLPDCVRFAVKTAGIPLTDAIACSTINPAKKLGIDHIYGKIAVGYAADLVLWDKELNLKKVILDGEIL